MKRSIFPSITCLSLTLLLLSVTVISTSCSDGHLHAKKNHKIKRHSGGIGSGMGG